MEELLDKTKASQIEPWVHFHWQNLNERKDGSFGSGMIHGRCWLRFKSDYCDGRTIEFCWNLWTHFCMAEFDIDDEGLTFHFGFPPVAFWLSFGLHFWPLTKWPKQPLSENYPNTMVVSERECGISIHDWTLYLKPWCPKDSWTKSDPWWKRGVSVEVNPFRWHHVRHEVRKTDGSWTPFVGYWEHGKQPDGREVSEFPYRYVLKNGTIQERIASVYVDRMAWRPRCLRWTGLIEKARTCIDVKFSDEVGERSGSWKGGCTGCSYELKSAETPEQCLRRMEAERKF